MTEREGFLDALKADRYDLATRLAYSDWLSENGFDEEAEWQRTWSPIRQQSEDFLVDLAMKFGKTCLNWGSTHKRNEETGRYERVEEDIWRDITLADLVKAGHDYIDRHDYFTQMGDETARDMMYEPGMSELFWTNWSIYTGRPMPGKDDLHDCYPAPFSCSC